jgi:1-phosphofructokinase family hexose kinase
MILTFTPNPCVDKTLEVEQLELGTKHRNLKMSCVAGGKGNNAARCVSYFGRDAGALVIVAGHTGKHVVQMIEEEDDVECFPFWTEGQTRTITTIYETKARRQTAFFEPGPDLSDDEVEQLLVFFKESLKGVEVVTLNGAVPCESLKDIYADMIRAAKKREIPVLLDAYGEEFQNGLACAPQCVKLNREEAASTLGFAIETPKDYRRALDAYQKKGVQIAIISDGPRDIYAVWEDEYFRVTPPKVKEVNPVGSGDVFAACIAMGMAEEREPETALKVAAGAAAANAATWEIGHLGDPEEVEELWESVVCKKL